MPTLRIAIQDDTWPDVLAALIGAYGPMPEDMHPRDWAEHLTAQLFAEHVASLATPQPPRPPMRRIRPSQVRGARRITQPGK